MWSRALGNKMNRNKQQTNNKPNFCQTFPTRLAYLLFPPPPGVCVDRMNLKYALRWHIHIYQFILCYIHAHATHTHSQSNRLRTANWRGWKWTLLSAQSDVCRLASSSKWRERGRDGRGGWGWWGWKGSWLPDNRHDREALERGLGPCMGSTGQRRRLNCLRKSAPEGEGKGETGPGPGRVWGLL